ncbi:lachesin-like [Cherax quadricarinatus]|uniref:lachesin-like n=1 Tax=Cherax quadricarinatus TaxID=27406 RepID=UPI00237869B6|nr:lachesin-like [Cherax quadricarinatus]
MKVAWVMVLLPLLVTADGDEAATRLGMSPAPPKFVHPAHNVTVVEGQEVTLMCSVTNLHGYKLAWVHEETQSILSIGRQLYTNTPRLSLHADHHSAGLTLSPVLSVDRGWYMCQLNTEPMTFSRSYLQVLVPPTLEEWSGSYVEVREGAAVRLTCRARAFPPALTTWKRADAGPIFRSPRTVWTIEGPDLVFDSVRREHTGAYTCNVDNNATAPVSRTTHLTVTYAPVLWLGRELVGTKIGIDLTLNCSSEANPPPQHYWTVNGTNITNSDKYHLEEVKVGTRTEVLLTILKVGPGDFTRYACHAINPTGHAQGTIRLYEIKDRVIPVPTRPTWHIPHPGEVPPLRHATPPPFSKTSTSSTTTSSGSRRTSGGANTHLGDSLRTTKLLTNKIPAPSGSWSLGSRAEDAHPNKITFKHRGGGFNGTAMVVDVMVEGARAGKPLLPTVKLILLLPALTLLTADFG